MSIEVSYEQSGGRALAIAEGAVTIKIAGSNVELVNGVERVNVEAKYEKEKDTLAPFKQLNISNQQSIADGSIEIVGEAKKIDYDNLPKIGKLKVIIDSYRYIDRQH